MVNSPKGLEPGPSAFPVGVVMECRRLRDNPWVSESWRALAVTLGEDLAAAQPGPTPMIQGPEVAQYLWTGLSLRLYPDEAESYYHNLIVAEPGCYVVTRSGPDDWPEPVLVTASFDEAQAYLEGDEAVHTVPLPPELYKSLEAFVLSHYVPEKRFKRKLTP